MKGLGRRHRAVSLSQLALYALFCPRYGPGLSIRRRLWDLARAELNDLMDRVAEGAHAARGTATDDVAIPSPEEEERAQRLARYYANLELPVGAPWDEVKRAYRRLMRRYHPDRHYGDPEKARIATELSQELRVAYEGLREHLRGR